MLRTKKFETSSVIEDCEYQASLKLIELLLTKNISLSHYNDFMNWKYSDEIRNRKTLSFESVIKIATDKIYGSTLAQKMQPKVMPISLSSGRQCYMVAFDSSAMIFDMLNNQALTQPSNLIFTDKDGNPFHIENQDYYNDIDTSSVYQNTFKELGIDTQKEVLCPLGLYLDELKLDAFGKMGLEPIVLTLLMYNRTTRNHYKAHRVIGYMPNFSVLFGSKSYTADQKANDYHQCLSLILKDLNKVQRRSGIQWNFTFDDYPNTVFNRKLIFPLFYVIGDAKGNDILAGRYGSRNGTTCIARDCDVKLVDCANPKHKCTFHKQIDMFSKSAEELKMLSFRKLKNNAFENTWFGSQPYGLFAALPPEPLHMFNMGIIERLAESFIARLSVADIKLLDIHVGYNCTHNCKQSDRSFPVMETFNSGVSEAKRLTAKEKVARIFCIYLTLLTEDFRNVITIANPKKYKSESNEKMTLNEYKNWVQVFEETLLLFAWIYLEKHPKQFFIGGRRSKVANRIVKFMTMYKKFAPRKDGQGLNLVKFHHLLHLWWVIRLFGSLLNVDGARGESNNIQLAKNVGKTTQKHHVTLNFQTAVNTFKRNLILSEIESTAKKSTTIFDVERTRRIKEPNTPQGSRFKIFFDYANSRCRVFWTSWAMKNRLCKFSSITLNAVFQKLQGYNGGLLGRRILSIEGFTEYVLNDENNTSIRACPTFRGAHDWYDWVNIEWVMEETGNTILPGQILMFLDTKSMHFVDYNQDIVPQVRHEVIPHEYVAIVHSAKASKRQLQTMPVVGGDGFHSHIASWYNMETCCQMISTLSLNSKCFILVDKHHNENGKIVPGTSQRVIKLEPKNLWASKFIDYSGSTLLRTQIDKSVTDPKFVPFED